MYLKKWTKTSHGIVFCLSNQVVQVYFKDHTEIFINTASKLVTFINKDRETITMTNSDALKGDKDIRKRLVYVREIL